MASEVLAINSLDSLLPAVEELVAVGGLAIHWAKAFTPSELTPLDALPRPEIEVFDDDGYPYNVLDIEGYPYNKSIVPIINELVLPPSMAFAMYAVHKMTGGPMSNALAPGSVPAYPRNPIGPNTMHANFEAQDLRPHHDGPRINGGLTFHATVQGEFEAEFGRPDYNAMPTRGQGWSEAETVKELNLPNYSGKVEGGPGDIFIFPGYGLPHLNVYPVVHKIISADVGNRVSAVFDPLSGVQKDNMPTLGQDMAQLVKFDAKFAHYPMWNDFLLRAELEKRPPKRS